MTSRGAATRYARALFDVTRNERKDLQKTQSDLRAFATLVSETPALQRVLINPAIPASRKRAVVEQLLASAGTVEPVVAKTLLMLAERDRLALLPDLADVFDSRVMDHQNVVRAEIVTAAALPAERVASLGDGLKQAIQTFQAPHPDRFLIFTEPSWDRVAEAGYPQWQADELGRSKAAGARGIKILKTLGLYVREKVTSGPLLPIDDKRFDPMWEACGALGFPVAMHIADPEAFFLPIDRFNERYEELHEHPDWSFYGKDYPSFELFGDGYMLTEEAMDWFDRNYAAPACDPRYNCMIGPAASGVPLLIHAAGLDPLRDQGRAYAQKAEREGIEVRVIEAEGLIHGFICLRRVVPSAAADIDAFIVEAKAMLANIGSTSTA